MAPADPGSGQLGENLDHQDDDRDEEIEDGVADYVLLTTKLSGKESPKLGVMVEEKDEGLFSQDINGDGKTDILNGNKKGVIVFWGK